MFQSFAHSELLSGLWPTIGIQIKQLTTGNSVNTYDADPQPAAGIDSWMSGKALFRNMLLIIPVSEATAGTLTITVRDSAAAITTANGAASTQLVGTLATISAVGLYIAEFIFTHTFATTLARVVDDADDINVRRYLSIRGTAAGGTFTFGVYPIFGMNMREFPVQTATKLAITWAAA